MIPSKSKRIVRLNQNNQCIVVNAMVCVGTIDEYVHVTNMAALRIERSHANDPALIQGLCTPCAKSKSQQEAQDARTLHLRSRPEHKHPVRVDDPPGSPLTTPGSLTGPPVPTTKTK